MAEVTKHATQTEKFLQGKSWSRETIEEAMPILESEFAPISDARSGSKFRSIAARNILLKFWRNVNHEEAQKTQKKYINNIFDNV
jgi:xanthine dehydrogenase small subunit